MKNKSFYTFFIGILFIGINFTILAETKMYQGLGKAVNLRTNMGKDEEGTDIYSINYVTASGLFDENGRILNIIVDILEINTPNYIGNSRPIFSG
ncbi:hypothetical protein [Fusobacterium sp.]|uniref:hypothetical protein n=1 Tax=Fusobacterium sp. TaxID=68766 RepID=UPI0029042C92|nr:hypothetical protein [Fusobacterium sp.]MDU1912111.1 hypothetical protein [Fusobacterium sp.]